MWFKRKRESDPDSALTETLRSLQSLLEDEPPDSNRLEPKLQGPAPADPDQPPPRPDPAHTAAEPRSPADDGVIEERDESIPAPSEDHRNHPIEEVTIQSNDAEELSWTDPLAVEFEVNADGEAEPERAAPEPDDRRLDFPDGPAAFELTSQSIDITSIDTIPLLTNVVFEPDLLGKPAAPPGTAGRARALESCIQHLKRQLEQEGLSPIDADQEQRLRAVLASILIQK